MKYLPVLIFSMLSNVNFAQIQYLDYQNIFASSHTYVGLPKADSLYIFGKKQNKWHQWYRFKIPQNTAAVEGNERRVFFLTNKEMIIQEYYNCSPYCQRDTLNLSKIKSEILPKNWIRNNQSTERDFVYLADSAMQYIYHDGDGWKNKTFSNPFEKTEKKDPKFYLDMPYQKIMTYDSDMYMITQDYQDLRFWIFDPGNVLETVPELKKSITPAEKLNVRLPKEVLSFFIYDNKELAWVYKDRIEFYRFDEQQHTWGKSGTPDLKFNEIF